MDETANLPYATATPNIAQTTGQCKTGALLTQKTASLQGSGSFFANNSLVELEGFKPSTSAMRMQRSIS